MSEQTLNELTYPVKLDNRHRGQVAELAFMRKAASLGFAVAKPYGEGERYDIVVCVDNIFWRVQVKSVLAKSPSRAHYRVRTTGGRTRQHRHSPYSAKEIDFLVAYIIAEDLWYIFSVTEIEGKKTLAIVPGSKKSRFERYREAWNLMRPAVADPEPDADSAVKASAAAAGT